MATELEQVLLDEVTARLSEWRTRFAGRPAKERSKLLRLALEREQVVAVAYREEAVAGRVADLSVDDDVRDLIRQTLIWIWKDEQLHAEYLRGELLRSGGLASHAIVYAHQVHGTMSGWTSATANHRDPRRAPFRSGLASALVLIGRVTGQIPNGLLPELRFQTFRHYCELSVALEASAALAYGRSAELSESDEERRAVEQIRADEERHVEAFKVLAAAITDDGHLSAETSFESMRTHLASISPWFVPASLRVLPPGAPVARRSFGSGSAVSVATATGDCDRIAVLDDCLDRSGLAEMAAGARTAAIRVSFMLGYDRRDRSNVNDAAFVEGLALYLRRHGVEDVAVLEAPTVYGNMFANRSVASVADYFGFRSPAYRIVDISEDLQPFHFERGFVQSGISGTWVDADLRIVMPKLRTDPTEFAHLSLSTLEGSTGSIGATFYSGRQVDFRSATMMLLDVAPPDFAVVDGWSPVADGPFGVMGCARPADVRYLYAGEDALAVDEVVLTDLGVSDPRLAPIMRQAYHWFGLGPTRPRVDGDQHRDLGVQLRGAHASMTLRLLGQLSYPVYMYLSDAGDRFIPAMDTVAFPELTRPGTVARMTRQITQRMFGLYPPVG